MRQYALIRRTDVLIGQHTSSGDGAAFWGLGVGAEVVMRAALLRSFKRRGWF